MARDRTLQIAATFVAACIAGFGVGAALMWWWPAAFVFLAGVLVGVMALSLTMAQRSRPTDI